MSAYTYVKPGLASFVCRQTSYSQAPTDAIVRCKNHYLWNSDLHIIKGDVPTCQSGTILGHEGIGIGRSWGRSFSNFKKGDKVLISCVCACGLLLLCKKGICPLCEDEGGWIFGHLIDCMQAEYLRPSHADYSLPYSTEDLSDDFGVVLRHFAFCVCEIGV